MAVVYGMSASETSPENLLISAGLSLSRIFNSPASTIEKCRNALITSQKYLKFLDQCRLCDLIGRVAQDGNDAARDLVGVDEGRAVNAEMPGPADGEVGVGFFNVDRLGIPIAG